MTKLLISLLLFVLLSFAAPAQQTTWELSARSEINLSWTSFDLQHPAGWFIDQQGLEVVISQLESDHLNAFEPNLVTAGYVIRILMQVAPDLNAMNLPDDPSLKDLVAGNAGLLGYKLTAEVTPSEFMTWPALMMRTHDHEGKPLMTLQGFYGEESRAFLLSLTATDDAALTAFLPTWQAMLETVVFNKGWVNMGDFRVNLTCSGSGSPVVILEANVEGDPGIWPEQTQASIAELTRVCTYNRVAHGSALLTFADCAQDTHHMLQRAGVAGPYVLVGPYIGGQFARVFAASYPDEVAAMVLVDSHPARWFDRMSELLAEYRPPEEIEADRAAVIEQWALSFQMDWEASYAQDAAIVSLGDIPLIVLTPENWAPGSVAEFWGRWQGIWNTELQPELAAFSSAGRLIIVQDAYHAIMIYQPEVLEAIQEIVIQVREQAS